MDLIIQATHEGSSNDITFTVAEADLELARAVCQKVLDQLGGDLASEAGLTKLSISGAGIMGRPGIAAGLFNCLCQQGINLRLIATSEIRTSCVVAEDAGVQALQVVHAGFGLGGQECHTAQGTASPHDPD